MIEEQATREFEEWWESQPLEWIMFYDMFRYGFEQAWLAAWRKYGREDNHT